MSLAAMLLVVTPTTIFGSLLIGVVLGLTFLSLFEQAIGSSRTRATWGTFVGIEVIGVAFFAELLATRWLDHALIWQSWFGVILLWTLMTLAATMTARLR